MRMAEVASMRARILAILTFVFAAAAAVVAPAAAQTLYVSPCARDVVEPTRCSAAITPSGVSTATENGHVLKASAGILVGAQINNFSTSTGLTVMLLDATAIPSNGTLATCTGIPSQTNPCILKWYGLPAAPSAAQPSTIGINWAPGPLLHFLNGLVAVCSSTGPVTLTLNANCTFSGEVQ